ncbi:hypothetical protein VIGAN_01553000 [Vigna angularis var. angularis]|uniref:Uncharacterized protein n=1 Tax=Vigna angularis var. angularis TaxID=157739 RepID=A0A0S3R9Z6_PHAAN|nr:hypothetical protein VIGAN_01553000 [Vigna angularis var. angularis]
MAQATKEPCKKEACDIQACLSKNNFLPQKATLPEVCYICIAKSLPKRLSFSLSFVKYPPARFGNWFGHYLL